MAMEESAAVSFAPSAIHTNAPEGLSLPMPVDSAGEPTAPTDEALPELVDESMPAEEGDLNALSAKLITEPGAAVEVKPGLAFQQVELITVAEQGRVVAEITGNAKDRATASLHNNSTTPYRVQIPAGQILESGRDAVVVLRDSNTELMPGEKHEVRLRTAALHSTNKVSEKTYKLSYQANMKVQLFLTWLADHPEVSGPTAQTVILALTENLPVNALAKFAPANGVKSPFETEDFRVETSDLIGALRALKDSGVNMANLSIGMDPQLRIESMIEPLSREVAKRYYGITDAVEWEFWKTELLQGDPSTRHYALFGIARFYPDIAIDMLPKWVRETKTHPVYRMSAIQAIADTQRPAALPLLRQLSVELGAESDLGKAANQAAGFLDRRLTQLAQAAPVVAFRGRESVAAF